MNRLARLLRHFFRLQAAEVRQRLRANRFATVSLSHWTLPMTQALAPVLAPAAVQGGRAALRRIAAKKRHRKDFGEPPLPVAAFEVFDHRVLEFVRHWTYLFCDSTNQTSQDDVATAIARLRDELSAGLAQGEALQTLTRRVGSIFGDPERAQMIAATETSRAMHGGQLLAARESGLVRGLRWLASADACPKCLALDGKEVALGEPFAIDPKGGHYAVILHAPRHPRCQCTNVEVLA